MTSDPRHRFLAFPALPPNVRAMGWSAAGALMYVVTAALLKEAARELPAFQIVFLRMAVVALLTGPWVLATGGGLRIRQVPLHLLRSLMGTSYFACFTYAIGHLIFATALTLAFTLPLWMIAVSMLLLGERPGWRRGAATLVGFAGVVLIADPTVETDPAVLVAIAAAVIGSLEMICLKKLTAGDRLATIVFCNGLFSTALAAIPAALVWQAPSIESLLYLLGIGATTALGQACTTRAYALGDATVVAPIGYIRLPAAVAVSVLVFGEAPAMLTLAGIVVVLAAILYLSRVEMRARPAATAPPVAGR